MGCAVCCCFWLPTTTSFTVLSQMCASLLQSGVSRRRTFLVRIQKSFRFYIHDRFITFDNNHPTNGRPPVHSKQRGFQQVISSPKQNDASRFSNSLESNEISLS
ncbi:hypothetical protein FRB91_000489 [Serendipita sp. 411]|nr:hypothetical protein FRB91_000489 [Serendipita sp. 411]